MFSAYYYGNELITYTLTLNFVFTLHVTYLPHAHAQGVKSSVQSVCLSFASAKITRSEDSDILVVSEYNDIVGSSE